MKRRSASAQSLRGEGEGRFYFVVHAGHGLQFAPAAVVHVTGEREVVTRNRQFRRFVRIG